MVPSSAHPAFPFGRPWVAILLLAGAILLSSTAAFPQTTITVNDATQISSNCTLSNAIASANADSAVGGCTLTGSGTPYTIQLQTNTSYTLATVDNWWYGPNALPPIATTIVIEGNGATLQVTDSTIVRLRFFFVGADPTAAATLNYNTPRAGNLTLHSLTLTGGRQKGGNGGGGGAGMGGAIFNQGTLTINQVTFKGNTATGGNGDNGGSGNGGGGLGSDGNGAGGVCGTSGGGFGGAVTPSGSTGGAGSPGNSNFGEAGGGGGGFETGDNGGAGGSGGGAGGGTPDGLGGNGYDGGYGDGSGGGSVEHSLEVFVPGPSGGGFGFGGGNGSICPISGLAAGGGGVGGGGGQGNLGGGGGGFGGGGGPSGGNGGFGGGGGGFGGGNSDGGGAGFGGAIFNHNGTLQVTNSTFNGNTAKGGTASSNGSGFGGAIFNLNGTVTLTFATVAGNTADDGGAVYNLGYNLAARTASLTLDGSILSNSANAAATAVDDLVNDQPSTVASGSPNAAMASLTYQNANIVVLGANPDGGTASGPVPITNDPGLAALMLNAPGDTQTMAITSASSAYEAAACGTTTVDQRGVSRPQGTQCDIGAYELIVDYTVTPSVNGANGTISPNTPQTATDGGTVSFTLTPNTGYSIGTVGGTCPAGTLSGSTYTTGAVTGNCTVIANFTINTYTVTPSVNGGNGTISPSTAQTVNYDTTQSFTLTPNTGYSIGTVGGTCPAGTLSGSTYTTGAVTGNCTVIANFTINTYTVTPSVNGGNGTISPSTAQTVNYDTTQSFTLTPNTGYSIGTVGGTCPAGTLSGSTYTTGAVTGNCTVIANFTINTYTVTPSVNGGNGTISPSTPQTVNYDTTRSFTLTPNTGYSIGTVGGTCPAGTLSGSTYTTGAVTGNCTVIANFTINTYTVTPSVNGGNGTISPSTAQTVNYDTTQSFTLTPNTGYSIGTVGGTCPAGTLSGSTYTTGAVTGNCTVIANFTINTYTVTPSVNGGGGTISPSTPQTVNYGATQSFTLTPNTGYSIGSVGGTCPAGTVSGSTYTTGAVTGNCTVVANFVINTYTVTPSVNGGNGTISPSTPQTVNYGATQSFTLTPNTGYSIGSVGGTCPAGTVSGSTYTTGAVTGNCTVVANFVINTYTVTPSVNGGNGTISPSTPQTVNYGGTQSFTLTPSTGYHIGTVGGTCPAGPLSGSTYTTGTVTSACTVIANFAINTYTVTPSVNGGNGTISPSTAQTVDYGATQSFTLTPNTGYSIGTVGGTCPAGTLSGSTYTTGAVTANCTVVANFAINTYAVTPSVDNSHGTISPNTVQTVNYGSTATFTVAAKTGYSIAGIGGTCAAGTLSGSMYTTGGVTANCTVVLNIGQAPAITSANSAKFRLGVLGSFVVTASGIPTVMNFAETGNLPSGVTLNPTTGLLSGLPAAGGTYPITITASNGITPNATQSFTLTVDQPPSITSLDNTTFFEGQLSSFTVTSIGIPTAALTESPVKSLPSGLKFVDNHNGTATLSGTPTVAGVFSFWIEASNGVSSPAQQNFTLTILAPISVSPSSLAFGDVKDGVASSKAVMLTNNSSEAVGIGPVTLTVTSGAKTQFSLGAGCPASLAGGGTCSITVVFTPKAVGTDAATLNIKTGASSKAQEVGITGAGTK